MIDLDTASKTPIYQQIYEKLRADIESGILPEGAKLVSKRQLSRELKVSLSTVEAAYSMLASEGFVAPRERSGYFVCSTGDIQSFGGAREPVFTPQSGEEPRPLVDFSPRNVARERFPYSVWQRLMRDCWSHGGPENLKSPPVQGDEGLRREIASYLYGARGVETEPDSVVTGAGTDQLLSILSCISDRDCTLAVEDPVYNHAYRLFARMGHEVLHLPVDEYGVGTKEIAELSRVMVYTTPSHQFPLGLSMPVERRRELLDWAARDVERFIIEDDYDSEFRYASRPVPSLYSMDKSGSVIYLGTFSRSVSPALRISYMVLPPGMLRLYRERWAGDFSSAVSAFEQRVLCRFISSGGFEAHLNRMRTVYKNRRLRLESGLEKAFGGLAVPVGDRAGHHLTLKLELEHEEAELCRLAAAAGARVYPISPYFSGETPERYRKMVLLGYGGLSEEEISAGVQLLKRAWLG